MLQIGKCKLHNFGIERGKAGVGWAGTLPYLPPFLSLTRHCQESEWEGRRRRMCACVCARVSGYLEKGASVHVVVVGGS